MPYREEEPSEGEEEASDDEDAGDGEYQEIGRAHV